VLLLPAIDLRAGRCVRLLQGNFSAATSYSADPVETARGFEGDGALWVHVVDLDAAEGKGKDNLRVIERIRASLGCRLQVGGGVRTLEQARVLLALGVDRLVLGTMVVRAPREVAQWTAELGPRFAAGIDARDGSVRIAGWTEDAARADTDVAAGLGALGVRWLVYTNISRDGTLAGPDIARTNAAAHAAGLPTILSGGIGSQKDVDDVAETKGRWVAGLILGKVLYEGRVSLSALVRRYPQTSCPEWDS
jgi:phosphoribosylformimino-5-aminoimidazole carboxamide ribotide isomerase